MKIISTFVISFLFTISSFAQFNRGDFLIGGGLGLSYSNTSTSLEQDGVEEDLGETTTFIYDVVPKIGYFFTNNFAGGLQFEITSSTTKTEKETNFSNKLLTGPFVRLYQPIGNSNAAIFLSSNVGFGRTSVGEGNNIASTSLFGVGVGPGFTLLSNSMVGIEALFNYNFVTGSTMINDVVNRETVGEFDLSLGVTIYFSRNGNRTRNYRSDPYGRNR